MLQGLVNRVRRSLYGRGFTVWYDPAYRLPLTHLEAQTGFLTRRADYAWWFLLERRVVQARNLRTPRRVEYAELARVHTPDLLASLGRPETLAAIWSLDSADVPVDEVMNTVRLACGATVDAARELVREGHDGNPRRALNLLGGFHHAGRNTAGGFCPVNDIAVAVAAVRAEGFRGQVVVLDLDAHPPDGIADCLQDDPAVFIGSISGATWGPLPKVDETVLPEGTGDVPYLRALESLLGRLPRAGLAFVVAGGDVLAGDPLGRLGLTLSGCRERDLLVSDALFRTPSVWLPAGGYTPDAWRVLAGTGLSLAVRSRAPISPRYDPLVARFSSVARSLLPEKLGAHGSADAELARDLGLSGPGGMLFLGYYSAEGLEHALERYGILPELRRLGYGPFEVHVSEPGVGQSARLVDTLTGEALIEVVLEKKRIGGAELLYVHWLSLRHPRGHFSAARERLPGQDVPGLGLAREMTEILVRIAKRLGLEGLAMRPSAYHLAFQGREVLQFVDPARQGRFEALTRDLGRLPLTELTKAVAEGKVRMNGQPYAWEPDEMVRWLLPRPPERAAIEEEMARVRFELG